MALLATGAFVAVLDELVANLKEAIGLQLEGENPADFDLAPGSSILANFELDSLVYAIKD